MDEGETTRPEPQPTSYAASSPSPPFPFRRDDREAGKATAGIVLTTQSAMAIEPDSVIEP